MGFFGGKTVTITPRTQKTGKKKIIFPITITLIVISHHQGHGENRESKIIFPRF